MADRFTKEQQDAISRRGGTILVGAAAGSGKTTVLAERIVSLLADETSGVEAHRLLVLTFSNAAAAEMRQRIKLRLADRLAAQPGNAWLKKQQRGLRRASIGTIHSFCASLLREHFSVLDIPPDFAMGDDSFALTIKRRALEQAAEQCYTEFPAGMRALTASFGRARSDREMLDAVSALYAFQQTLAFPEKWQEKQLAEMKQALPPAQTAWGQLAKKRAWALLAEVRAMVVQALDLLSDDETQSSAKTTLSADLSTVLSLEATLASGDWDSFARALSRISFDTLRFGRSGSTENREEIKALRQLYKKQLEQLQKSPLQFTEQQVKDAEQEALPVAEMLFTVCGRFRELLMQMKLERRLLEFDDLETLALRLLCNADGSPTEQARAIAAGFDAIFVDEFQDTNERQKYIFEAVSQNGQNLFCVGDVKQSIYRFRRADPSIFLEMRRGCYPAEAGLFPAYLSLHRNFRSERPVLDAVNAIFRPLMTEQFGGVDYQKGEQLEKGEIPGAVSPPDTVGLELVLEEEKEQLPALVARYVEEKLQSGYPVADHGVLRPCREEDFCILLRAPKAQAAAYQEALLQAGVRCSAAVEEDFFAASEILTVLSLLRILDNPRRDVDLLAVMFSPLFGFTPDDAAALRLADRKASLWALLLTSEEPRCRAFVSRINAMREQAACSTVEEIVQLAITETDAELLLAAPPDTALRRARLQALVGYAAQYTAYGGRGLSDFLRHCENAAAGGRGPAVSAASQGVTICSIHRAKGLEWPIVILADASHGFNKQDARSGTILTDSKLGMGLRLRKDSADSIWTEKTPRFLAIAQETERAGLEEELRVLYVALTRARQKIAVFAHAKPTKELDGPESMFAAAERCFCGGKLLSEAPTRAGSFAAWIAMAFCDSGFRAADCRADSTVRGALQLLCRSAEGAAAPRTAPAQAAPAPPLQELQQQLQQRLDFRYPFAALSSVPTKIAVTQHTAKDETPIIPKPDFARGGSLSAAERGTALHNFMQLCSYANAARDPAAEVARLLEGQFLDKAAAESIRTDAVAQFFQSELGQRVLNASRVLREYAFIDSVDASEILPELPPQFAKAQILVQGIADCVILEEDAAVLVDYKTDRVQTAEELRARYAPQLRFYRRSIQKRLGVPVKQCLLWSFHLGEQVEV